MKTVTLILIVAVCAFVGCRRTDVRTFTVSVPELTQADLPAVAAELGRYGGVERGSLTFDAAAHTLTLNYDSMQVAKKNIEMSIAKLGFTANGVTPESIGATRKAAVPPPAK